MEENGSKHLLLQADEVELPIDGSLRRKRRRRADCVVITINTLLCIISCIAATICIVYCNWVLAEARRSKGDIDVRFDRNLKSPVHSELTSNKLFMKQKETTQDSIKEDASKTVVEPDLDFDDIERSADTSAEGDAFNNADSLKETESWEEIDEDPEYSDYTFDSSDDITEDDAFNNADSIKETESWEEIDEDPEYSDYTFDSSDDITDDQDDTDNITEDQEDYAYDELDTYSGDSFDDEEINTFRLRRALPKTKGKKEEGDFKGKSKQKSKKTGRGKQCRGKGCRKGRKTRRQFIPLAAQYDATVSDDFITENLPLYNKLQNTEDCAYIDEMQGDLCRDRLYTPNNPAAPLNIFHGNPAFSSKKSPLQHIDGSSTFLVKGNGSMLVFAQVSFSTNRPTNGVSVFQSRTTQVPESDQKVEKVVQTLQCKQGIPDDDAFSENVNQSCSIVGLLMVKEGDKLEIYSNYKKSALDLSQGSTYFGAVQLTKG